MRITDVTFAASLNCPTKCFLCLHNETGGSSEFSQWEARIQGGFETAALDRMCSALTWTPETGPKSGRISGQGERDEEGSIQ
jgi:hypothetical protein